MKVRVPFYNHFSFILSFNFEKNGNKMKRKMIEKSAENGPRMATVNNPIGPKPLSARSNYDLVHASLNDFESSFLKQ